MTPDETWEQCSWRVANAVANDSKQRDQFFRIISERLFLPGGRYLYCSGRPLPQYNNCTGFIAGDSREDWAKLLHDVTLCLSMGAGLGINYSNVRGKGTPIKRMGGEASGPLALMQMVNEVARWVMAGGKRRSALFGGLAWDHPDIHDFLAVKQWNDDYKRLKEKSFEYAAPLDMTNISVLIDDKYINGLKNDDPAVWKLHNETCELMCQSGEPGFINMSARLRDDPGAHTMNACCEATLHHNDVCNLGSIVLPRIRHQSELEEVTRLAIQFLYQGSMKAVYPTPEIGEVAKKNRRIGLGVMGLHEWLLKDGAIYEWTPRLERWMKTWSQTADHEATALGRTYGVKPVTTRAIAPTGTISIVAETTGGIEPIYCLIPGTRVLTASLDWINIENLNEGDDIVGFREKPLDLRSNKLETSTVLSKTTVIRPTYRITTDRGIITASADHLWVTRNKLTSKQTRKGQGYNWVSSEHLSPGMQIAFTIEPWSRDSSFDGGWLSGMFDGEGHFRIRGNRAGIDLSISQNEGKVLERVRTLLAERNIPWHERRVVHSHPCMALEPFGTWQKLRLLGMIRPTRLLSKMEWGWTKLCGKQSPPATILSVEFIGEHQVVALGTSTRTLIAEGFLSHNCVSYKRRYIDRDKHYFQYVVDPTAKRLVDLGVPAIDIEDAYRLSRDIDRRLNMQAHMQEYVDQAISSTINIPQWGTSGNNNSQDFATLIAEYLPRIKGLTIYPNNARAGQPLSPVDINEAIKQTGVVFEEDEARCNGAVCGV